MLCHTVHVLLAFKSYKNNTNPKHLIKNTQKKYWADKHRTAGVAYHFILAQDVKNILNHNFPPNDLLCH